MWNGKLIKYSHLLSSCNQNAPAKLENTVFFETGRNPVAENIKGVTA